jgi:RNA polymerase sigma-70 factor, ECF subfamily
MTAGRLEHIQGLPRSTGPGVTALPSKPGENARLAGALDEHFDLVWRSMRRFGVPESAADDAAQQVFLILAERLTTVAVGRERAFLLAVSLRVAANFRRLFERSREVPLEGHSPPIVETPEDLLQAKQQRDVLDQALATLPLEQRAVFVLFELEGFSLPEIADSLGIPLGTATSRLRRARRRFEMWVAEYQNPEDCRE